MSYPSQVLIVKTQIKLQSVYKDFFERQRPVVTVACGHLMCLDSQSKRKKISPHCTFLLEKRVCVIICFIFIVKFELPSQPYSSQCFLTWNNVSRLTLQLRFVALADWKMRNGVERVAGGCTVSCCMTNNYWEMGSRADVVYTHFHTHTRSWNTFGDLFLLARKCYKVC